MKKFTSLTIVSIMAIFLIFEGCKKEEDKVLNKITIEGNTDTAINTDYIPESGYYNLPYQTNCNTTLYRSEIWINFTSGGAASLVFIQPSNTGALPLGTFNLSADCVAGFLAFFYLSPSKTTAGICLSSGTITVAKSGDIYDVDVNLSIHSDCGGGTIKGNFNGTLGAGLD